MNQRPQNESDNIDAAVPARGVPSRDRSRFSRSMLSTIPIVLAGSMAMSLNLTGPITPAQPKTPKNDRSTPTALGKSIRDALAAAHAASTAEATSVGSIAPAAAPSEYVVAAGDTVSSIAGRFGIPTASVLALNGLGWKSVIYPGQTLKLSNDAPIAVVAPVVTPPPAAASGAYTIVAGDTIGAIAGRFGTTTAALLQANGLTMGSIIYPGRSLVLPGSTAPAAVVTAPSTPPAPAPAPAAPSGGYKVVAGDTMGAIAGRLGVTTAALLAANGMSADSIIFPGQTLTAPGQSAPASVSITPVVAPAQPSGGPIANTAHVIVSGETVASIAQSYGVTVQAILDANGLGWSSIIYSGQTLVIPSVHVTPVTEDGITPLTPEMTANASAIISVGRSVGVSDFGLVVALSAAMQESSLRNIDFGDLDSLGLFQQRPSAGWGAPEQLTDPVYASRLFFGGPSAPNRGITRGLLDISGWQSMSVTQAAQAVQISAYPEAYAKWESSAWAWLGDLT